MGEGKGGIVQLQKRQKLASDLKKDIEQRLTTGKKYLANLELSELRIGPLLNKRNSNKH